MDDMLTPYSIFITIIAFIFLILLIYIISIIVYPKKPIELFKKSLNMNASTDINDDATFIKKYNFEKHNYNLYYLEKTEDYSTIIVDLPGGAFISSSNTLKPYLHIDQPYNIISVEYPVLPYGKLKKVMEYLEEIFNFIKNKHGDPKIILCGASAGCFYATKILNLNKYNIIKYISTCGYYGYKTIKNIITIVGDKFYLRNASGDTKNDCIPPPSNIQCLYVVGSTDELRFSTINYLETFGNTDNILQYEDADHTFYLRYNSPIAQKYYKDLGDFIKN